VASKFFKTIETFRNLSMHHWVKGVDAIVWREGRRYMTTPTGALSP
jgi:hypothetical protein